MKVALDDVKLRIPKNPASFLSQMSDSQFLACDLYRADEFYDKFGRRDKSARALKFYDAAYNILFTAKRVLDDLGVRFWLSSGTCLGGWLHSTFMYKNFGSCYICHFLTLFPLFMYNMYFLIYLLKAALYKLRNMLYVMEYIALTAMW